MFDIELWTLKVKEKGFLVKKKMPYIKLHVYNLCICPQRCV